MEYHSNTNNAESDLIRLEQKINMLIKVCDELKSENNLLRERQASLVVERAKLIEQSELARTKLEAMIERLKLMENDA